MKDATVIPRPFKRYSVSDAELKDALGIDWPGHILSVHGDYYDGFTVTMQIQPDELTGEQRERLTIDTAVRIPVRNPAAPPETQPAQPVKRRWQRS
jgi:hypothetical protein